MAVDEDEMKRLLVSEATPLDLLLRERFGDEDALRDGRVFLREGTQSPRRALLAGAAQLLAPGTEVQVHDRRGAEGGTGLGDQGREGMEVLFEGFGLFVVAKPAGMSTIPDHGGVMDSLQGAVAQSLRRPIEKVHPTSRLDRDVSGVVIFALDEQARWELSNARDEGTYGRRYVGISSETRENSYPLQVDAPIGRHRDPKRREVGGRDAAPAQSRIELLERAPSPLTRMAPARSVGANAPGTAEQNGPARSVGANAPVASKSLLRRPTKPGALALALYPKTGRTHQLRLHASHCGIPLFGDRTYGGEIRTTASDGSVLALSRIALHAAEVTVPVSGADGHALASESGLVFRAPVPEWFDDLWAQFSPSTIAWIEERRSDK